jgi:glycosyltransferase involved in cell wall biosynthesis
VRILHLAFEDHRRPGSGGGSLRNREINSRLARLGYEIDVVTTNYPGAAPREEDGVSYRQRGLRRGYAPSLISHQLCLPWLVARANRRAECDLIVEEFAPLTSSLGVGHWTPKPTVGVAQGFFAEEKARQYHLPRRVLCGIQAWGTRSHPDLIAVSEDVAARVRATSPSASVTVIPNGVDWEAASRARARRSVAAEPYGLFLGRLEIHQKGLDVLLAALAEVSTLRRLVIAGDGKDRNQLERAIRSRGLGDRIELAGAVHGESKWGLLAGATMLIVPSRYETFGITALEAMACGTPVIMSDLACLRELVPGSAGMHCRTEDPVALAQAIDSLMQAPERRRAMAARGPEIAEPYGWDDIARRQAEVYEAAVSRRVRPWIPV